MDESLFKRLELHTEAVVQLNVQYRMNRYKPSAHPLRLFYKSVSLLLVTNTRCLLRVSSQIMSLSNSLMYEGQLECGSDRTATALLTLPFLQSVQSELSSHSETDPQHDLAWIQAALLPSNPVCFLDCSKVGRINSADGFFLDSWGGRNPSLILN